MQIRVLRQSWATRLAVGLFLAGLWSAHSQPNYSIDWFSTAGGSQASSGSVYSVSRLQGPPNCDLMRSSDYAVAGSYSSGTVIAADEFYMGIDLHDPVQALADLNGDGFSNLMEYGLGTDPRDGHSASGAMLVSTTAGSGGQFLTFQFKRRKNAASLGLQYIPEVSADGQIWYSDIAHVTEVGTAALDTEFDWVTVRDQAPTTPATPRFVRLRLVEN